MHMKNALKNQRLQMNDANDALLIAARIKHAPAPPVPCVQDTAMQSLSWGAKTKK